MLIYQSIFQIDYINKMSLYDDELLDSNKDGSGKGLLIIIIE
jgi:hypothetical protein